MGDFLLDLVQNSVEAGALTTWVVLVQDEQTFAMTIRDDGRGMDEDELVRAQDPFFTDGKKHPTRRVGLGLPFVIQTTRMTQGWFQISSRKGEGTEVTAGFRMDHWDTPPLGDLPRVLSQIMAWDGDQEIVVTRRLRRAGTSAQYRVTRSELRDALGRFDDVEARTLLTEYFRSREHEVTTAESSRSEDEL